MTRPYAARRLLEHGPLVFRDFVAITGWPPRKASVILSNLRLAGKAKCINHGCWSVWSLA